MFESFIMGAATDVASATATLQQATESAELKATTERIHNETSGPAGDIHVEMQSLVDFYNTLSQLHEELAVTIADFRHTANKLNTINVGGKVPGVQQAWEAMTKSLGANDSTHSLAGNLQAVDNEVVSCMAALQHNAQAYASQEDAAIAGFGKASGTARPQPHHTKPAKHHAASSAGHASGAAAAVEGSGTITSTSGSFGGIKAR